MTDSEDIDDRYRRASAANPSRPPDSVRNAVLEEAARIAAQRGRELEVPRRLQPHGYRRPALLGMLAAAVLAGFLVIPRFLSSDAARMAATRTDTAASAAPAAPAPPAPQPEAPATRAGPTAMTMESSAKPRGENRLGDRPQAAPEETSMIATSRNAAAALKPAAPEAAAGARAGRADRADARQAAEPIDVSGALRSAAATGDVAAIDALLDRSSDVNARDEKGRTALMLAILSGQSASVDALLARGADANGADGGGLTPLQAAIGSRQSAIAEALRRAGAH